MIQNENDLRALVREECGDKARWVEPGLGSSYGLPDCWVAHKGHCVHLELKLGRIIQVGELSTLAFDLRPGQRQEIKAMMRDKIKVGVLVGLVHSNLIWFLRPVKEVIEGRVGSQILVNQSNEWEAGSTGEKSFESGINMLYF